jgi:hypothetical protein
MDVSIVKRCKDGSFEPGANCYLMRWRHPIEKNGLQSYYIWLDTTVVRDSVQEVSQTLMNQAAATVVYNDKTEGDSLDLTDLISGFLERDSLHIAIWAKYSGSEQGAVQHLHVYFGDDVSPSVISFRDSVSANTIWIDWVRPTDQRDFYFPEVIDGPIAGYNITIRAETNATEDIRNINVYASIAGNNANPDDLRYFYRFNKDGRGVKLEGVNRDEPRFLRLAVIDGKGFVNDNSSANNWRMQITGLKPESSYNVTIVALDSSGNRSGEYSRPVMTTDNIAPLIASEFWSYKDPSDGLRHLDSNRLILFWLRSVDPLSPTQMSLESILSIPSGASYREVSNYLIEQWNGKAWDTIPRVSAIRSGYYSARYSLESDSMKLDPGGKYVSDTLRWVLPGDTIILRMRAIDSSGHYSSALINTIYVSKGELGQYKCPANFAPVRKDSSSVFCMEKLEHASGNGFEKNVLFIEAKRSCEASGFNLCTEQEWNAACNSRGSYGIIEDRDAGISGFLSDHCGVGTGDSLSAVDVSKRSRICASPDGIRDLPGQLQEWVIGSDGNPLLKGSSYAIFEEVSKVELAQCRNHFTPTRIRPRYTMDSAYLYRNGSRVDTMLTKDTLRTLYAVLPPSSFTNTLLVYTLKSLAGDYLGEDYVDQAEYNRRGGDKWLEVLWQGLNYEPKETLRVLIKGKESINAHNIFLDPTVGFRCCTGAN